MEAELLPKESGANSEAWSLSLVETGPLSHHQMPVSGAWLGRGTTWHSSFLSVF